MLQLRRLLRYGLREELALWLGEERWMDGLGNNMMEYIGIFHS